MAARGFENYPAEWWHYTFTMHPQPTTLYDVPVQ
jgi:D-alanyl-D-alanine dipeptidase